MRDDRGRGARVLALPGHAWRAATLVYAGAQFLALTFIAMLVFPGGSKVDPQSAGYQFFDNFFSELGVTRTESGLPNVASRVLFAVALASVGLALIVFSGTWKVVAQNRRARSVGFAAQLFVAIAGLGFIGNALTPWDTAYVAHNVFFGVAFGLLLAYVGCLTVVQVRNRWSRTLIASNVCYVIALAAYLLIVLVGPGVDSASGIEFQATAQKVIVYLSALALTVQALGIYRRARQGSPAEAR